MNKTVAGMDEALRGIEDGAMVAIGGFFAAGVPRLLLRALIKKGVKDLTLACGSGPLLGAREELGELAKNRQIRKVIDSYGLFRSASKGAQHPFEQQIRAGEIELEVYPWGPSPKIPNGRRGSACYIPVGAGLWWRKGRLLTLKRTAPPGRRACLTGKRIEFAPQIDLL